MVISLNVRIIPDASVYIKTRINLDALCLSFRTIMDFARPSEGALLAMAKTQLGLPLYGSVSAQRGSTLSAFLLFEVLHTNEAVSLR